MSLKYLLGIYIAISRKGRMIELHMRKAITNASEPETESLTILVYVILHRQALEHGVTNKQTFERQCLLTHHSL